MAGNGTPSGARWQAPFELKSRVFGDPTAELLNSAFAGIARANHIDMTRPGYHTGAGFLDAPVQPIVPPVSEPVAVAGQIDFEIYAWCADDAVTVGCDCCYATVRRVSCGSHVQVGDSVIIYDLDLCWFNVPIQLLIGLRGWAQWMESTISSYPDDPNFCLGPPDIPTEGQCLWIVRGLCCYEEVYGALP